MHGVGERHLAHARHAHVVLFECSGEREAVAPAVTVLRVLGRRTPHRRYAGRGGAEQTVQQCSAVHTPAMIIRPFEAG